jgi:tetratricopeptide (TPR) repeat protein
MKSWLPLAVLLIVPSGGSPSLRAQAPPDAQPDAALILPTDADFPVGDESLLFLYDQGNRAKLAARNLATAPEDVQTLRLLMASGRFQDALNVLRNIVNSHSDLIAPAFTSLVFDLRSMLADGARNYGDALRLIVDDARKRSGALPRERAADVARALVNIDTELARDPASWRSRLAAFAAEYAGTEAALLTQVDLLGDRPSPAMIATLDAFVADHPGTTAAAKALYEKGFHLAHNGFSFGERAGQDPTDRFFRVYDVVRELQSGKYPSCEWIVKAPLLVTEFSAYQPVYAAGSADRILTTLEAFLPGLLREYEDDPSRSSIAFVIGGRMRELLKRKGDVVAGLEGVFSRLQRAAKDPDQVTLLKAEVYVRRLGSTIDPNDWPVLRAKGLAALQDLVQKGRGRVRRRAMATLARLRVDDGDCPAARVLYDEYVADFPESGYAWVAALRAAQCQMIGGDAADAERRFHQASVAFGGNPIALVLGLSNAARSAEAMGQFSRALQYYESALAGWDRDYGPRYTLDMKPPQEPLALVGGVTQDMLTSRIEQLKRSNAAAGGDLVERGRWLIDRERWEDAATQLTAFRKGNRASPLFADGTLLFHRARLEQALDIAEADKDPIDVSGAVRRLRELAAEPPDFAVCAAQIALATLIASGAASGDADATMAQAMRMWQALDQALRGSPQPDTVERDVVDIRNVVFRPQGSGVFQGKHWNAFNWESARAPYFVFDPALRVKTAAGELLTVRSYDQFPEYRNVLFLGPDRRTLLERVMLKLGGTKRRPWTQVMQTPHQPAGAAVGVVAFWNKSFPVRSGHWSGWVFETYPAIMEIEFIDATRTKAAVKVTVGYSGATVQMEKKDGAWLARDLTNFWVT